MSFLRSEIKVSTEPVLSNTRSRVTISLNLVTQVKFSNQLFHIIIVGIQKQIDSRIVVHVIETVQSAFLIKDTESSFISMIWTFSILEIAG